MDQQKKLEQLVIVCIDTAKAMLDEYKMVVPFGIRCFKDSEDMKMNCPIDEENKGDWEAQINKVVLELKDFVSNEDVLATALVTELQSGEASGIGLQVETIESSVLFVYPFKEEKGKWVVDEPVQTEQLFTTVF